jgi:signal transduction histidine kinase
MPLTRSRDVVRFGPITTGARVFALVVLAPPVAFTQSYPVILSTMLIAAVWTAASFTGGLPGIPLMTALVVEASLVAFLAALPLAFSALLVPALVISPFIGGLYRGSRGGFEALGAQVAVLVAFVWASSSVDSSPELLATLFTWLMAGLGFGLIGAVIRAAKLELGDTTKSSYRDARALLTQLLDLSDDLVGGLDPVSISNHVVDLVREEIPLSGAVVHARTPDGTISVIDGDNSIVELIDREALVDLVFATGEPIVDAYALALPLQTDAGVVAVLTAGLGPGLDPAAIRLDEAVASVVETIRPEALKLDTALVFSAVREAATTSERQRLAREMHDGVAQDLASFGYLIDDLAASAETPEQATRLAELREELTSVVTELRRSVFSLRNEAARERSLGASLTVLASHLEARTGIVVEVIRDEGHGRLRPDVEGELLRIAQEAMNNAVKHASASLIRVTCTVAAPRARITVTDDGVGLRPGRDDSHGLRIMRERAKRIGAVLDLVDTGRGTRLEVALGQPRTSDTDSTTPTSLEGSTTR